MGKIISTILTILGVLFLLGMCDGACDGCGCGGSIGCDGCDISCDGCDIVDCGGCGSCDDCTDDGDYYDPRYDFVKHTGNITLKIHRADGTTKELSGSRNLDDPNSIFYYSGSKYRIRDFGYADEVGYEYRLELAMDDTTYTFYDENNGINTTFNSRLMFFHNDGAVVELTERRTAITYQVTYIIEANGRSETLTYDYNAGGTVFVQELQDKLGQVFSGSRYMFEKFVIDGTQTEFKTDGVVNAEFVRQFNGGKSITVRAVSIGQKVNVKLHYNMEGVNDETKIVPFNFDLNSLWDLQVEKVQFFGWSTTPDGAKLWSGDIPEQYTTETLELYAIHKHYKEIQIEGQAVRVYDDNTLSITKPDNAVGLRTSPTEILYLRLLNIYSLVEEGKTYYWRLAD